MQCIKFEFNDTTLHTKIRKSNNETIRLKNENIFASPPPPPPPPKTTPSLTPTNFTNYFF